MSSSFHSSGGGGDSSSSRPSHGGGFVESSASPPAAHTTSPLLIRHHREEGMASQQATPRAFHTLPASSSSASSGAPSSSNAGAATGAALLAGDDDDDSDDDLHLDDTDLEEHSLSDHPRRLLGGGSGGHHHSLRASLGVAPLGLEVQAVAAAVASSTAAANSSSSVPEHSRFIMFASWFALLGSVMSMSATGPMFLHLQRLGVSPILACVWRNQCTCLFLIVPAVVEWRRIPAKDKAWDRWRVKGTGSGRRRILRIMVAGATSDAPMRVLREARIATGKDWHVCWFMCGVSVVWTCSLVLWVSSLPFTSTARASLLTSIYPLLLVLWLKFGPSQVELSTGEILGVLVSFAGIATCEVANLTEDHSTHGHATSTSTLSPAESEATMAAIHAAANGGLTTSSSSLGDSPAGDLTFLGDGLCLAAAFFIAADIVISKKARQVVPLFTYTLGTCFLTLLLLTVLCLVLEEDTAFWSLSPTSGVFGWTTTEKDLVYLNVFFGVLEGAVGLLGFNFAVRFVNPLVFSSVQLLDPGLTGILSYVAGLEPFPSVATFLGIAVVTCGIGIVVVHQHRRETREMEGAAGGLGAGARSPNAAAAAAAASVEMTHQRKGSTSDAKYTRIDRQAE